MRYFTATLGAAFIFSAVFALALLFTNWPIAIAVLQRDGLVGLLQANVPAVLLASLCAALSFSGTLRYHRAYARGPG